MKIDKIPIWLINLDRSKDRLEFQEQQFKEQCLNFTRFPAVDGRSDLTQHLEGLKKSHEFHKMSNGQLGCALSHIAILKKIVAENIPAVLVMEDDAVLCENFKNEFETIFHDDDLKNDIIYVGNQKGGAELKFMLDRKITKIQKPTFCTHGLIYTLNGAKRLLEHINQVGLWVIDIIYIQADTRKKIKAIS